MGYMELLNGSAAGAENHEVDFGKTSFSLALLLKEAVEELRVFADTKSVKIKIVGKPHLPKTISSDPVRLKLVLVNIIGNALRFVQDTEMAVVVDCVKSAIGGGTLLQVTVKTGVRQFGGNRVELYQSKKMARILGGDVVLKFSAPDLGASFIATFLVEDQSFTPSSELMH